MFSQAAGISRQAQELIRQDRQGEALDLLARSLESFPRDAGLLLQYALLLSSRQESDKAVHVLLEAEEALPENPALPLKRGVILYDARRFDEALEAFQRCLNLAEANQLARHYRALTLFAIHGRRENLALFCKEVPDNNTGFLARFCCRLEAALAKEREESHYSPSSQASAQITESIEASAIDFSRMRPSALMKKGVTLFDLGEFREAIDAFKALCDADPGHAMARLGWACSLAETCDYAAAKDVLVDFLDKSEEEPPPLLLSFLSLIYVRMKQPDTALALLGRICVEGPDDYNIHYNKALAHLARGDQDEALRFFEYAFRNFFVDTMEDCLKPLLKKIRG